MVISENKLKVFIILNTIISMLIIASSLVLILNFHGEDSFTNLFRNFKIETRYNENHKRIEEIKEEIREIPYLSIFDESSSSYISNLSRDNKILYYKMMKMGNINHGQIQAIIDLMNDFHFRYDYFLCAILTESLHTFINESDITKIILSEYKENINTNLSNKSQEYKNTYIRGLYFNYLSQRYQSDLHRLFTEYNMGYYETVEYLRRNSTYRSEFSTNAIQNLNKYKKIYTYYLKSIL
ncbi:hypothetical protein [Alkalithermobacter paradoxus]|uniref:Uncharacterized protein n=1 Tax=Alkalithermobacter paradoxus TaxID=29349 RepID=A0A1V4I4B9_9FIRM|nr:hypothetical protein CLOTH_19350 [[Clostridium] thermoalcaliphilum]